MTDTPAWDNPAESEFFVIKDHVGSLCLIAVNGFTAQMATQNGFRDTVHAEIAVIDGPNTGKRYPEALLFGAKLNPQIKGKIGRVVLGRIALGQAQAGKNAPYVLLDPTSEDGALANAWVAANGALESKPIEQAPQRIAQAATQQQQPNGYGQPQWQVQQHQAQGYPPPQQYTQPPQPQGYGQSYPQPTYTGVGAGDQAPF